MSGPTHISVIIRDLFASLDRIRCRSPELEEHCQVAATVARELAKGSTARLPETAMDRGPSPLGWYWNANDPRGADVYDLCQRCIPPFGGPKCRALGLRPILAIDVPSTGLSVKCARCGLVEKVIL